jgi:hypothetical protein
MVKSLCGKHLPFVGWGKFFRFFGVAERSSSRLHGSEDGIKSNYRCHSHRQLLGVTP